MDSLRLDLVLPHLRCPVCAGALSRTERTVRCPQGHAYDVARQGYVTLLAGGSRAGQGDTADWAAARGPSLARAPSPAGPAPPAGAAAAAPAAADAGAPPPLAPAGGPGPHRAAVLDAAPRAVGLDVEL